MQIKTEIGVVDVSVFPQSGRYRASIGDIGLIGSTDIEATIRTVMKKKGEAMAASAANKLDFENIRQIMQD